MAGFAEHAGSRGDHHQTSMPGGGRMSKESPGGQERYGEIGVEGFPPPFERQLPDGLVGRRPDSRIGDHHIHPAERFESPRDETIRFGLNPQVGADGNPAYLGGQHFGRLLRGSIVNGHPGAFCGEMPSLPIAQFRHRPR